MTRRILLQHAARPLRRSHTSAILPSSKSRAALPACLFSTTSRKYATPTTTTQLPTESIIPSTKPPSARPIETRKSQMIRTYTSLLRTTPLILFFQHSNLTAVEWAAVRRELKKALGAVAVPASDAVDVTPNVKLEVVRTNMLNVALKIVEFYDADAAAANESTPRTVRGPLVHDLSETAYETLRNLEIPEDSAYAQMQPLMIGPLATLVIPAVSPQHLAAALSVLAPVPGVFPAPKKSKNPGYHDPICQNGLAKLMLVGGRIEGKIFDQAGVNWVGGIENGLEGLRAQLVHVLQSAGLGLATTLEGTSKSLWLTMESRRTQLDEEANPKKEEDGEKKE